MFTNKYVLLQNVRPDTFSTYLLTHPNSSNRVAQPTRRRLGGHPESVRTVQQAQGILYMTRPNYGGLSPEDLQGCSKCALGERHLPLPGPLVRRMPFPVLLRFSIPIPLASFCKASRGERESEKVRHEGHKFLARAFSLTKPKKKCEPQQGATYSRWRRWDTTFRAARPRKCATALHSVL